VKSVPDDSAAADVQLVYKSLYSDVAQIVIAAIINVKLCCPQACRRRGRRTFWDGLSHRWPTTGWVRPRTALRFAGLVRTLRLQDGLGFGIVLGLVAGQVDHRTRLCCGVSV
jgi:hypothetical protein